MSIKKYIRENILSLMPYSTARDEFGEKVELGVFLDANENPYDNGINRYPDPYQSELRNIIAELKGVDTDRIFLGNGSDEAIDVLFRVFCEPGIDKIISLKPSYGMYKVLAQINNVEILELALDSNFDISADDILNSCDDSIKMIFLCSPNNPTGNLFSQDQIEKLVSLFDGIVVLDEAYIDFASSLGCVSLLDKYSNLVILQTLSKAWGMAGLRIGVALASSEIVNYMQKVKYPYNIGVLAQREAIRELTIRREVVLEELEEIKQERESLFTDLQSYAFIKKVYKSEANFILIRCEDALGLYRFLVSSGGIIVRDRSNQYGCDNCLRITVGKPSENILLIEKLNEYEKSIVYR